MRDTMAELVKRLRELIGDPAGVTERFSDDRLEELLERHGEQLRTFEERCVDSFENNDGTNGRTFWRELLAPFDNFEDGVVLRDYRGVELTPATSDLKRGRWTFEPSLLNPEVFINGTTYDLAGAGADALEEWANSEARAFDVQSQGTTYVRSQKVKGLRDQALELRRRQRVGLGRLVRSDEC
jgi:hypothetical protein